MKQAQPAPLALQWRGEDVESVHQGHLAVVDVGGGEHLTRGEPAASVYARSSLKPVQVLPLLLGGAAEAFGLPDEAIAVAMASHSGEACHREAVSRLLERAGVSARALQCGTHEPYHAPTARALIASGEVPTVLHCNCSGKHAAMLAVCRHHGFDPDTYREPAHPLQRWIRDLLAELSDLSAAEIGHAVDGCGVPVWRLPVARLARVFARLGTPTALRPELRAAATRAGTLMARYPRLIGGEDRLDTDLMAACGGAVICKIGGEGVHAGAIAGTGLGWAIKVADGHKRALGPALARALAELGHPLPDNETLAKHIAPVVRNNRGEQVGTIQAAW